MPLWRNSVCMPKVRASSATIGTTRGPSCGSLSSCASSCTNTMVVDCSRVVPSAKRGRPGTASFGAAAERAGR